MPKRVTCDHRPVLRRFKRLVLWKGVDLPLTEGVVCEGGCGGLFIDPDTKERLDRAYREVIAQRGQAALAELTGRLGMRPGRLERTLGVYEGYLSRHREGGRDQSLDPHIALLASLLAAHPDLIAWVGRHWLPPPNPPAYRHKRFVLVSKLPTPAAAGERTQDRVQ